MNNIPFACVQTTKEIGDVCTQAIYHRPFLRGLFWGKGGAGGLIFGRAYLRREICVSKSIGLAL